MAVQLELSQMLVDSLTFENQIVGLNKSGCPIFVPTPSGAIEWIVRDGGKRGQSGFALAYYVGSHDLVCTPKGRGQVHAARHGAAVKRALLSYLVDDVIPRGAASKFARERLVSIA